MREGAWFNADGEWSWISEHASWIQRAENARSFGLPDVEQARLCSIPWDFNGPGREAILRAAMDSGLIRMRGHGASVTFEFTLSLARVIQAVGPFMERNFGPRTWCQFNDLETGECLGIFYEDLGNGISGQDPLDLAASVINASVTPVSAGVNNG